MKNDEENIIDKFLNRYDMINNYSGNYQKIYKKPSKIKSIIGFISSLALLLILIRFFVFKLIYFMMLIPVILVFIYYAVNLFTKKGIGMPTFVQYKEDLEVENKATTKNEGTYRVDR